MGHLSNSSQWAFSSGWAPGRQQLQLETGTESVLGETLPLPKSSCLTQCLTFFKEVTLRIIEKFDKLEYMNLLALKRKEETLLWISLLSGKLFFIIKNIWKAF